MPYFQHHFDSPVTGGSYSGNGGGFGGGDRDSGGHQVCVCLMHASMSGAHASHAVADMQLVGLPVRGLWSRVLWPQVNDYDLRAHGLWDFGTEGLRDFGTEATGP